MWTGSIYRESRPIDGSPNALYGSFRQSTVHHSQDHHLLGTNCHSVLSTQL